MKTSLLLLITSLLALDSASAAQAKAILDIAPALTELGPGWTTNLVAYLLDPQSQPSEIDFRADPKTSLLLEYQRSIMQTNNRTGCALLLYGRSNLVMNSGLYRVYIQRWTDTRALHNHWVTWKMDPTRVVRNAPPVGEDCFWTQDWWRETLVRQNFIFRTRLFHIVIEAGSDSDYLPILRLAEVMDAKIRGRPIPPDLSSAGPIPAP